MPHVADRARGREQSEPEPCVRAELGEGAKEAAAPGGCDVIQRERERERANRATLKPSGGAPWMP